MKCKIKNLPIFLIFLLIFFWDLLDEVLPNIQFVFLLLIFILHILIYKKIASCKYFLILWLVLLVHGVIGCIIGTDSVVLLFKQLICIGISYVIFKSIIAEYKIEDVFNYYWIMAFIMSCIGVLQIIIGAFNISFLENSPIFYFTNYNYRVVGIVKITALCREQSFLAYLLAPAVCSIIARIISPELVPAKKIENKEIIQSICILIAYICTFSVCSIIGIGIILFILWLSKGINIKKLIIPVFGLAFFLFIYNYVPEISVRVNSLWDLFNDTQNNLNSNLSSYTYYMNFNVMKDSFIGTHGIGAGLGGYQNMFDRYSIGGWSSAGMKNNREDANSALFRIISELGIIGVIGIVAFLKGFFPCKSKKTVFSFAMFTVISMFLIRQGNYVHAGSILFICIYVKAYYECKKEKSI